MTDGINVPASSSEMYDLLRAQLRDAQLKFTTSDDSQFVLIPFTGEDGDLQVVAAVDAEFLVFLIPKFVRMSRELEHDAASRAQFYARLLQLNDKLGIVKFAIDEKGNAVSASIELLWKQQGFLAGTIGAYVSFLLRIVNQNRKQLEEFAREVTVPT
jgi:hypothetical protein